jgi:hypothetical protein
VVTETVSDYLARTGQDPSNIDIIKVGQDLGANVDAFKRAKKQAKKKNKQIISEQGTDQAIQNIGGQDYVVTVDTNPTPIQDKIALARYEDNLRRKIATGTATPADILIPQMSGGTVPFTPELSKYYQEVIEANKSNNDLLNRGSYDFTTNKYSGAMSREDPKVLGYTPVASLKEGGVLYSSYKETKEEKKEQPTIQNPLLTVNPVSFILYFKIISIWLLSVFDKTSKDSIITFEK